MKRNVEQTCFSQGSISDGQYWQGEKKKYRTNMK